MKALSDILKQYILFKDINFKDIDDFLKVSLNLTKNLLWLRI